MEAKEDSQLIQNLLLKRELLQVGSNEHERIRTALVILGGGMKGVNGAGSAIAFHLLGLGDVFDVVVGISTGAGIGAYFLGGLEQALLGTSIYYEELPPRFIKYSRRPIADVDFVEAVLRGGKKKLDVGAITRARSGFFVGVTDVEDGSSVLLDAKRAKPDIITALKASMAMLGLYNKPVEVNGRRYIDSGSYWFPIREIVNKFVPTDILVLPNCSREWSEKYSPTLAERIGSLLLLRGASSKLQELFKLRYKRWQEDLQFFATLGGVNKGILWAPDNVGLLAKDSQKLRRAAEKAVVETLKVFGKPHKPFQLL